MARKRSNRWTREEHILALNMYLSYGEVSQDEEMVVELSNLLRTLNDPEEYAEPARFRNPTGVASKVNSFAKLDPTSEKFSSESGELEEEIWEEFAHNTAQLGYEVQKIISKAKAPKTSSLKKDVETTPEPQRITPVSTEGSSDHLSRLLSAFRDRLVDLSRNNRLLNFRHGETSNTHIRLVDCGLKDILKSIAARRQLEFTPLPPYEFEPRDELTDEFQLAYEAASLSDPEYIDAAHRLTMEESSSPDAQAALERELRDRVREKLGMGPRLTTRTASPSQIAQAHNIDPSYSLEFENNPDQHEYVRKIQTLFVADRMESKLSKLRDSARRSIEETGVNRLYLAIGFVEWYEAAHTDRPNFAPLLLISTSISRQTSENRWRYFLNGEGEPIRENIALRIRLSDEGIDLPQFEPGDDIEEYFEEVQSAIDHKDKWKVHNYATAGLFAFSNIELWADLDPAKWPGNPLNQNANVQKLFGSGGDGSAAMYAEEHNVDDPVVAPLIPPLVLGADSSQLSAMIDALQGRDLAIKGPPGTGKSQTIANLIAAFMYAGKKVLFVAEKMAALEVVKSRLDDIDLGDFILELHSSKAHTINLVRSLNERVQFTPSEYHEQVLVSKKEQLETLKQRLNEYSALLNMPAGRSGKTVHDALWASQNRRFIFEQPEYRNFEIVNPEGLGTAEREQYESSLRQFESSAKQIVDDHGSFLEHPWYWVGKSLDALSRRRLIDQVSDWLDLENILTEVHQQLRSVGIDERLDTPEIRHSFIGWVKDLPTTEAEIIPEILEILGTTRIDQEIRSLVSLASRRGELLDALGSLKTRTGGTRPNGVLDCYPEKSSTEIDWESFPDSLDIYTETITETNNHLEDLLAIAKELDEIIGVLSPKLWIESAVPQIDAITDQMRTMPASINNNDFYDRFGDIREAPKAISELEQKITTINQINQAGKVVARLFSVDADLDLSSIKYLLDSVELITTASAESLEFRSSSLLGTEVQSVLQELSSKATELTENQELLSTKFRLESIESNAELVRKALALRNSGAISRLFSSEFKSAKNTWLSLAKTYDAGSNQAPTTRFEMASDLMSIVSHRDEVERFHENATGSQFLGKHFRGLETNFSGLIDACTYMNQVQNHWRAGDLGQRVNSVLKEGQNDDILAIKEWERAGNLDRLRGLLAQNDAISDSLLIKQLSEAQTELDWYKDFQRVIAPVEVLKQVNLRELPGISSSIREYIDLSDRISQVTSALNEVEAKRYVFKDTHESILSTLKYFDQVADTDKTHQSWSASMMLSRHFRENTLDLQSTHSLIQDWIAKEQDLIDRIEPSCKPDFAEIHFKPLSRSFMETHEVFKRAFENVDELGAWMRYLENIDDCSAKKLNQYVDAYDPSSEHPPSVAYNAIYWHSLAQKLLERSPILRRFSGSTQENVQEQFRTIDKEILNLNQKLIAYRLVQIGNSNLVAGLRDGPRANWTEMSLINVLIPQTRPRPTIRDVLRRAGTSIQSLKPCFMMSPNSVAQFLAPGGIEFDVLIIDEASQMRPEEAIGSVARSGQAIIVGDPMQLPPTSFFSRVDTLDEELEEDVEDESILDRALASYTPYRELRWHYRSRHHDLINFSNRHFYQNRLVVFPSPESVGETDLGVRYNKVEGTYMGRGGNPEEAKLVAEAAIRAIKERPDWSVGIVAMNREQTDLIRTEFDQMLLKDPLARRLWDDWEDTLYPGFIKNLENVQGDERDRIIISTVYGPNAQGRVLQQFGPIVNRNGHRRLNVLFTRARNRVDVYSSMSANDIRIDERSGLGVRALRGYLEYAATHRLESGYESDREPDSEFEIFVADALRQEGYEVVPQVGVEVGDGKFYIDLGVVHPGYTHGFLAGIECDGASYHSGKSARDRDNLREEILEGLRWDLYRIWSTDWFNDSRGETQKLIRFLEDLKEKKLAKLNEVHDQSDVYIDDLNDVIGLSSEDGDDQEDDITEQDNPIYLLPRARDQANTDIGAESKPAAEQVDDIPKDVSESINPSPRRKPSSDTSSTGNLTVEEARSELISYRESIISERHRQAPRNRGILRRTMLELLLTRRPVNREQFRTHIPEIFTEQTEKEQIDLHLEHIFSVLARITD